MLTREQVLDELVHLAAVAHAQCVQCLFLGCALGNGADFESAGLAPPPPAATDAFGAARSMATTEMRQLRRINAVLTSAGRAASVGRATKLRQDSGPALALAPLTAAQLDGLLDRELALATAVDRRYARLAPSVDPAAAEPLFDEALGGQIAFIVEVGSGHAAAFGALRAGLAGLAPSAYLLVTRDAPANDAERRLRDLSDRYYALIVSALSVGFGDVDLASSVIDNHAVTAMFALDAVDSLLAVRGLLPAFTLPAP